MESSSGEQDLEIYKEKIAKVLLQLINQINIVKNTIFHPLVTVDHCFYEFEDAIEKFRVHMDDLYECFSEEKMYQKIPVYARHDLEMLIQTYDTFLVKENLEPHSFVYKVFSFLES